VDPRRTQRPPAGPPPSPDRSGRKGGTVVPLAPRRGSGGPPAAAPGAGEALDRLTRDIRQLQVEYERFFNGALPLPPEELRNAVQAQLKTLRNANLTSAADNFRLGDLEARYNTYHELFNRRLREREEGPRGPRPAPPLPPPGRFDVERGILVSAGVEPEAAEALYQGLAAGGEAARFDLDSFHSYLERQAAAIRAKTGCEGVQFRLAREDGKLKLKARPIRAPGP
jgi:hypothetical protein